MLIKQQDFVQSSFTQCSKNFVKISAKSFVKPFFKKKSRKKICKKVQFDVNDFFGRISPQASFEKKMPKVHFFRIFEFCICDSAEGNVILQRLH